MQPLDVSNLEALSVSERILLVEQLWDSIAAHPEAIEVPQAQIEELDRRLAAFDASPEDGASWQEVKAQLREQS